MMKRLSLLAGLLALCILLSFTACSNDDITRPANNLEMKDTTDNRIAGNNTLPQVTTTWQDEPKPAQMTVLDFTDPNKPKFQLDYAGKLQYGGTRLTSCAGNLDNSLQSSHSSAGLLFPDEGGKDSVRMIFAYANAWEYLYPESLPTSYELVLETAEGKTVLATLEEQYSGWLSSSAPISFSVWENGVTYYENGKWIKDPPRPIMSATIHYERGVQVDIPASLLQGEGDATVRLYAVRGEGADAKKTAVILSNGTPTFHYQNAGDRVTVSVTDNPNERYFIPELAIYGQSGLSYAFLGECGTVTGKMMMHASLLRGASGKLMLDYALPQQSNAQTIPFLLAFGHLYEKPKEEYKTVIVVCKTADGEHEIARFTPEGPDASLFILNNSVCCYGMRKDIAGLLCRSGAQLTLQADWFTGEGDAQIELRTGNDAIPEEAWTVIPLVTPVSFHYQVQDGVITFTGQE